LESGPLSDPEFPKFAADVVLFLHNTSHVEDEPYPTLLQDKGFSGFPSLCFMDAEGNVLTKPSRSVAAFRESHVQAKKFAALRAKGDKATPAEQKELFLHELKSDLLKAADIQPRADKLTLSAEEKALVAGKLVDLEVREILRRQRQDGPEKTGAALEALLAAGKTPSDVMAVGFWGTLLGHAAREKDAKLAQRAYDVLEEKYGSDKRYERQFTAWKKQLEDAKAK
jgi:hypothetical protein